MDNFNLSSLDCIQKWFNDISEYVKKQNNKGYFDAAKKCEDLFCDLLNTVYGWDLDNLNYTKNNSPIIDLGDYEHSVCVQVTSCQIKVKRLKLKKQFVTLKKKTWNKTINILLSL